MRDLSPDDQRGQHRGPRRARVAPRAAVDAMAGPQRQSALERRGLPLGEEPERRPDQAPQRGAARSLGLHSGTTARRDGANAAAADACRARRGDARLGRGRQAVSERGPAMTSYQLTVNGERKEVAVDPGTPLLWVLREELKLTGTKYGCGIGACGACTVHLGGIATRSCLVPVSLIGDRAIVTIEGIAEDKTGRAVQEAWVD